MAAARGTGPALLFALMASAALTSCSVGEDVRVTNAAELSSAIAAATFGTRILLVPGRYAIERTLTVPDGVTLRGAGVMQFDDDGVPVGFEPGTETALMASPAQGGLVVLGDDTAIEHLRLEGRAGLADEPPWGSVVVMLSRRADDSIGSAIVECEIVNPNPFGYSGEGPAGHAILVLTLNPGLEDPSSPHEGARLALRLQRSVVRATAVGGSLFALNFASRARVEVALLENRIDGTLLLGAGTNRPDSVSESLVIVESQRNVFAVSTSASLPHWQLVGASSPPHHGGSITSSASANELRMRSTGDRIEGMAAALSVVGGRALDGSTQVTGNRVLLDLEQLRIATSGDAPDFRIVGGLRASNTATYPTDNVVRLRLNGVQAGNRTNVYVLEEGFDGQSARGNRIEIEGEPNEFARNNRGVAPPPEGFFVGAANRDNTAERPPVRLVSLHPAYAVRE